MSQMSRYESKADYLIEKGMMLLWSKGYNGTSVKDIVNAAEVPKGSFYHYFSSKEDFAVKAIEKYFEQMFPPALQILKDKRSSPKQRIVNFYEFRSHIIKKEFKCRMGCMGSNLVNEIGEHNDKIRNAIKQKSDIVKSCIAEVIQEAQDLNEINNSIKAMDLANFMEDAGRGAMVSMKELNSGYPIDNLILVIKHILNK